MDYTVIGDTVNVAARLEGLNKELGTSVLVSGETAAGLSGAGATGRPVGEVQVKGRNEPIRILAVE